MNIFTATKHHDGYCSFLYGNGSEYTSFDVGETEYDDFRIMVYENTNREIPAETAQLFDTNLPNGARTSIDFHIRTPVKDFLQNNFQGKLIKKIGFGFQLSGYPDDYAPCTIVSQYKSSAYLPIAAARLLTSIHWTSLPFTDDMQSPLYLFKDFSAWDEQSLVVPIVSHGYYGCWGVSGFHFKFTDPQFTSGRFWQGYIMTAEEADDIIVGETEVEEPAQYIFDGYVSSVGETEFVNNGTDPDGLYPYSNNFSQVISTSIDNVPCWLLDERHNFVTLGGGAQAPYSLEAGVFCLELIMRMVSSGTNSYIMGNTYGTSHGNGGFTIRQVGLSLYFSRKGESIMDANTARVDLGSSDFGVFKHFELSVDSNNIFRCFINGVKKLEYSGMIDYPVLNSGYGTFVGRNSYYDSIGTTYFYLASLKLSRSESMIHTENFTPPGIGE